MMMVMMMMLMMMMMTVLMMLMMMTLMVVMMMVMMMMMMVIGIVIIITIFPFCPQRCLGLTLESLDCLSVVLKRYWSQPHSIHSVAPTRVISKNLTREVLSLLSYNECDLVATAPTYLMMEKQ